MMNHCLRYAMILAFTHVTFISIAEDSLASDVVKLQNVSLARCLNVHAGRDNREGGTVTLYSCANTRDQEWEILNSRNGWKKLKNRSTGRCLNIHRGRENREGGLVSVYSCASSSDQEWKFIGAGDYVQLKNRSTGRCLNVHRGQNNFEGAPATSYTCANSPDQQWKKSETDDGGAVGSVTAPLVGGFRDRNTPRRNATVRLEGNSGNLICSGVLISPNLVLSAGHCWDPGPRPRPPGRVAFSPTDWETPGDWYPLPATIFARVGSNDMLAGTRYRLTQYSLAGNTDIIMFRLAGNVPSSQAIPVNVITTNGPKVGSDSIRDFLVGKTLRLAGWGARTTGTLPRYRQTIADVVFIGWPVTVFGTNPSQMIVRSSSGVTIQGGDSGGPLYWQDGSVLKLIGITQGEGRHVMTFYRGGTRGTGGAPHPDLALWINEQLRREDCMPINSERVRPKRVGRRWKVIDAIAEGDHWIFDFDRSRADANKAVKILRHYNIDRTCYVNRPNSEFNYLLAGSDIPTGRIEGEDCLLINRSDLNYEERSDYWLIKEAGGSQHFKFDKRRGPTGDGGTAASRYIGFIAAHASMALINKYGPRFVCYVGRPGPGLVYLRR